MTLSIVVDFIWIPPELGGHSSAPYLGMRLSIRWQKHIENYLQEIRDVECQSLEYDLATSRGKAKFRFATKNPLPSAWLEAGQLIELLNGFHVLAVGKLISSQVITRN